MPEDVAWHFIGHVQSNKVKLLARTLRCLAAPPGQSAPLRTGPTHTEVPNLAVVESVGSAKLASALDRAWAAAHTTPLRVFVQVNTSGEDGQSVPSAVRPRP
jgi:PLP dependent protein